MNTLQDTINTLSPGAKAIIEVAMMGARNMFKNKGDVIPGLFVVPLDHNQATIEDVSVDDSEALYARIRKLREENPTVGFISEAWIAKCDKSIKSIEDLTMMPSQMPNRQEAVMLTIWDCERTLLILAKIHRNPNKLDEWKVTYDSMFPQSGHDKQGLQGNLAEGKSFSMTKN